MPWTDRGWEPDVDEQALEDWLDELDEDVARWNLGVSIDVDDYES